MSYEIAFYQPGEDPDDDEAGTHLFLASTAGWDAFLDWVTKLPGSTHPSLVEFCENGIVQNTEALRDQLKRAFKSHRPQTRMVTSVARQLFRSIGVGDPEETAMVQM